jgi:hypothetical protein
MFSEKQLFDMFRKQGLVYGGELFLSLPGALEFIRACEKNNLSVIGLEGFTEEGRTVMPRTDMIADYSSIQKESWQEFRETCNNDSKKFLIGLNPKDGILISFTLFSEEEWHDSLPEPYETDQEDVSGQSEHREPEFAG